jgi:hypothetical protein
MAHCAKAFFFAALLSVAAATSCELAGSCVDDETSFVQVQKILKQAQAHAHTLNDTSGSGQICCCKKGYCSIDSSKKMKDQVDACIGTGCPHGDKDVENYCCTKKSYAMARGCPLTSGYSIRMESLTFSNNKVYDSDTCYERATQDGASEGIMLKRQDAFQCRWGFEERCKAKKAEADSLPADWEQKPKICHGSHAFLKWIKPKATKFFDTTQTTGLVKAGGANGIAPVLTAELAAVAGPIALAGGAAGIFVNVLKLIDGVCINGWSFLTDGNCAALVSMTAIVLGVVALALTFTGVGVPLSGLLLGGAGFLTRRLGADICNNGLWNTLKSMGQSAYDSLKGVVSMLKSVPAALSNPSKLLAAAKNAAIKFFGLFFTMLRDIATAIPRAFKAMFGAADSQEELDDECCSMALLEEAFEDVDDTEEMAVEAIAGKAPTDETIQAEIKNLEKEAEKEKVEA